MCTSFIDDINNSAREHVLYTGAFQLPDKNAAAHRVVNVGKILKRLGAKVSYLERGGKVAIPFERIKSAKYYKNSNNRRLSMFSNIKYLLGIDVLCQLGRIKNITTIALYNYHALPALIILSYARFKGIKVIGDITEWYNVAHYHHAIQPFARLEIWLRMKFINKYLDGLIVISGYLLDFYRKYYHDKIIKLPPLIDFEDKKWISLRSDLINRKTNKDSAIKIFYAGSIGADKDDLLSVMKFIKSCRDVTAVDIQLILAGVSKQDFLNITKEFETLNSFNWITTLGRIEHKYVIRLYKECDGVVLLRSNSRSNSAGFSTKLVEAVSSDLFVVINRDGFDLNELQSAKAKFELLNRDELKSQSIDLENNDYSRLSKIVAFMEYHSRKERHLNEYFDLKKYQERMFNFLHAIK